MLQTDLVIETFVTVEDEPLGIGKYKGTKDDLACVEWFTSVRARETKTYTPGRVKVTNPPRQMRCYIDDYVTGNWYMGRIVGLANQGETGLAMPVYRVRLPGGKDDEYLSVKDLYVRCLGPASDPLDTLALLAHDTPYFHTRRAQYLDNITQQRASACGLLSVVSSKIRLYSHQFGIVRRVLEDPIQRYLLADEVGLGKTIEAGAIIRQVLMDNPSTRALILTPPQLEEQWRRELADRFGLTAESRVTVRPTNQIDLIDPTVAYEILVIDEAHHVAAGAQADTKSTGYALYASCQVLAGRTPRVLLLSATPAINHEQDFLALLHLIDLSRYRLEDIEKFRRMVANRQPIGRLLLALPESIARPPLRSAILQLRTLFVQDDWVQEQADRLQRQCDADQMDRSTVASIIRELRIHICESHRIFQRMLRTSRRILGEELHWRGVASKDKPSVGIEAGMDAATGEYLEHLEDWRMAAAAHVWRITKETIGTDGDQLDRTPAAVAYGSVYAAFIECASWLPLVTHAVRTRHGLAKYGTPALPEDTHNALRAAPLFPGEVELLEAMLQTTTKTAEPDRDSSEDQMSLLINVVRQFRRNHAGKVVVFTQFTLAAEEMQRRMGAAFPNEQILSYLEGSHEEELRNTAHRFEHERACNILICDRRGEEGLNLQFTDLLIHFDIPWNANRIEQRIGRVDRIGRSTPIQMKAFLGGDDEHAPDDAWLTLLQRGFRVFSESVTDLQFYISDKTSALKALALCHGPEALVRQIAPIRSEVARERVKLAEQSALDEIEAFDVADTTAFDKLVTLDGQSGSAQRALEAWAIDAIQFERQAAPWMSRQADGPPADVRYEPTSSTLYPDDWKAMLRSAQRGFSTFDRERALRRPGLDLLRIGSPFVDTLTNMMRWDDRGQAFAFWRVVAPGEALVSGVWYRIDYLIEADRSSLQAAAQKEDLRGDVVPSLVRRADALYPPARLTVFLNEQGELEQDIQTLRLLTPGYQAAKAGGADYNLDHERLQLSQHMLPRETWADGCYEARQKSDSLIRSDPDFQRKGMVATQRAEQVLLRQANSLRTKRQLEYQYMPETSNDVSPDAEIRLQNAVLNAVRTPRVIADAMGVIVLSNENPFVQVRNLC